MVSRACRGILDDATLGGREQVYGANVGDVLKKIIELLLCILHPVAVVLIWINLVIRSDIGLIAKLTWAIAAIVPFVPFVYVLTGNDFI
ncbi:MAG: hypothetical protein JOY58_09090 [Solirubrobacterales bacterium]|nr:hypothetical protein [Solirubrobacterales bacterium]